MTNYFVLTGHIPDQTCTPKRSLSVSFGDTNASLELSERISDLCRNTRLLTMDSSNPYSKFSGRIYDQNNTAPFVLNLDGIFFDSTQLISAPGAKYDATLEIEHPNLPWKIKEDIAIFAQLDDEPICFAVDINDPVNFAGIYPNQNWLDIAEEMKIICTITQMAHPTWPRSFGTSPLVEQYRDFSNYSELNPLPFGSRLLILKAEINDLEREFPYSKSFITPEINLPTMFDIFELENDENMWKRLVSQVQRSSKYWNPATIKHRISHYKEVLTQIWKIDSINRCNNCIHCRIYEELDLQGRPSTITKWILQDPDKIPNCLRPMIATILMIPDHVWEADVKWMPYYSWIQGSSYLDRLNGAREISMARGGIFFRMKDPIIPVRNNLPIRKTCAGYTSGIPIRMEFWVGDQQQERAIVNWMGGLKHELEY